MPSETSFGGEVSLISGSLSHYRIIEKLGAGGMGEVYLARDAELGRTVALKILPAEVAQDRGRMGRFEQEARAASALNHPNILTIYEVGHADSVHFIATEFIEGDTLRRHMKGRAVKAGEVLGVAAQVADALAAAHEAGIVHRDIKPENIMLRRRDGYVKVLDFGLAKLSEPQAATVETEAPTKALVATDPGVVMGTVQYMSPEQARGLETDARTDIWSLGVVLYEMVAGRAPFEGETASDTIASILNDEPPPLARYSREVPETLEWIVAKALRKDREERYQTAKELLTDLRSLKRRLEFEAERGRSVAPDADGVERAAAVGSAMPVETAGGRGAGTGSFGTARTTAASAEPLAGGAGRRGRVAALAAAAVLLAAGGVVGLKYFWRSAGRAEPFAKMKVTRLTTSGKASRAAISPDGKYVVHVAGVAGQQSLLLRHIATGSDKEIVPSNGNDFTWVTFSRDGSYVLYSRVESGVYPAYQVPVLGGPPKKLVPADADTPFTFSPDGKRFAFMRGEPDKGEVSLILADADGSGERRLVAHKISDFYGTTWPAPSWSPDGETIAFAHRTPGGGKDINVFTAGVRDGAEKQVTSQKWSLVAALAWLADGSGLVVAAADAESGPSLQLWHVSYPGGEARRITNDTNNYQGVSMTANSSALVTVQTEQVSNVWVAPDGEAGRAAQLTSGRGFGSYGIAWSPDGRIVYASEANGRRDIWIMNADGTGQTQLTADAGVNNTPSVSPDGRYIVFNSNRAGTFNIWRMDVDGGNPVRLTGGVRETFPTFSPDGQWVLYTSTESDKQMLRKVSVNGGDAVRLTDYSSANALASPDGKLLACGYIDEGPPAKWKLAVIPSAGGRPVKSFDISTLQSRFQWSPDGRALLYSLTRNGVTNIWSQPVEGGPPKQLTDFKSDLIFRFDWSRDGRALVLARGTVTSDVVLIADIK